MKLKELVTRARNWPIFGLEDCQKWFPATGRRTLVFQLSSYVKQGDLLRLKRGIYILNEKPFPHLFAIASRLDPQSIIGLETVLHNAGIIPDIPFATTAVTSGKTMRYQIDRVGVFLFRHIKPSLIFGFHSEDHSPYVARVSKPEKALLDLLWYHRFERDAQSYIEELRLFIPKNFSWERFRKYAALYQYNGLARLAQAVIHAHT